MGKTSFGFYNYKYIIFLKIKILLQIKRKRGYFIAICKFIIIYLIMKIKERIMNLHKKRQYHLKKVRENKEQKKREEKKPHGHYYGRKWYPQG